MDDPLMSNGDLLELVRVLRTSGEGGNRRASLESIRSLVLGRPAPVPVCKAPVFAMLSAYLERDGGAEAVSALAGIVFRGDAAFEGCHATEHARVLYSLSGAGAVDGYRGPAIVRLPFTSKILAELPEDPRVPTYVRRLGVFLEHAFRVFREEFGLDDPTAGGSYPIGVEIQAAGATAGPLSIVLTPHYNDELLCAYTSHELFHVFQYAAIGESVWQLASASWSYELFEGGAVFAEDAPADTMNRYLVEAGSIFNRLGLLADPGQSLMTSGYKAALFWRYLTEQAAEAPARPDWRAYTRALRGVASNPTTDDLEQAIEGEPGLAGARFCQIQRTDEPGADQISSETVLGNFALACYLKDVRPDRRTNIAENSAMLGFYKAVVGADTAVPLVPTVKTSGPWRVGPAAVSFESTVAPFGHHFLELDVDQHIAALEVEARGEPIVDGQWLLQVVELSGGDIRDVLRWDARTMRRRITVARRDGMLTRLVVVVSGTRLPHTAAFSVSVRPASPAPDIMVTRWNCRSRTEYELDPRGATWTSPDVTLETGDALLAEVANVLIVSVHNRGGVEAHDVSLGLGYQVGALASLRGLGWRPAITMHGAPQGATALRIPAGATERVRMVWTPPAELVGASVCLRVCVRVPSDPNTDNKVALSMLRCRGSTG